MSLDDEVKDIVNKAARKTEYGRVVIFTLAESPNMPEFSEAGQEYIDKLFLTISGYFERGISAEEAASRIAAEFKLTFPSRN